MRYCSLQHWILLSPPDTSTTDHHFCFGPAASFFLELLVIALHSFHGVAKDWTQLSNFHFHFPSSILDTFQPGGLQFWCHIFLPFHTVHGVLTARILKWIAISSSSGPRFVRTLHYDLFVLGGPRLIDLLSYTSPFTTTRL